MRVAPQNQCDNLLALAGVLDARLAAIARHYAVAKFLEREARLLRCLPSTSSVHWQGWNHLWVQIGDRLHALFAAMSRAMAATRHSSLLIDP